MTALWDRLAGADRVRAALLQAAAHPGDSYLFVGPRGVGKAEAARVFAAAVLCAEQCGTCATCSRVLRGIHPDVQTSRPEGYTYPVDLIRELVAASKQSPIEAARRIFIVEEADRIAERSQNALLKALEEPNLSVTWVLVADALEPFLATILSRCRMVEFAGVSEEAVGSLIGSRFGLPAAEARMLARIARGDLERAIALAGDERVRALRDLAITAATRIEPSPRRALEVAERVGALAREAREAAGEEQALELAALEDVIGTGRGTGAVRKRVADRHRRALRRVECDLVIDFLDWLAAAFRDLAAASAGADAAGIVNADRAGELADAAGRRPAAVWLDLVDAALAGRLSIVENASPQMAAESVLLRLAEAPHAAAAR